MITGTAMDFELSEQQAAFRDLMREFARKSISPVAREWELAGRYPEEIVGEMKAMGLFGMVVPEEFGGIAIDAVSYSIVFEEISKAWMGVAGILGSHSLATLLLSRFGTPEQQARWLPDLATGKRRSGIALTEPQAGRRPVGHRPPRAAGGQRPAGHRHGGSAGGRSLRGQRLQDLDHKRAPCGSASGAGQDRSPCTAATPRHERVDDRAGNLGLQRGKRSRQAGLQGPGIVRGVLERLPRARREPPGRGGGAWPPAGAGRAGVRERQNRQKGGGRRSGEPRSSLAYARQRHAFGKPIAEFQAIQLKLADMATEVQAARLLTWWAASALDSGRRADLETGMAKLYASEVCIKASLEAMRIHGGYGYSTEYEVERFYRDAPLMAIGEGTNDILRTVIARQLVREDHF